MKLEKTRGKGTAMIFLVLILAISLAAISYSVPVQDTSYITFDREKEEMTVFLNGTDSSKYVDAELNISYNGEIVAYMDQSCQITNNDTFICQRTFSENGFSFQRGHVASVSGILINKTNNDTSITSFGNITPNKPPRLFNCDNDPGLVEECEEVSGDPVKLYAIRIKNNTFQDKPRLTCEYYYVDEDGDSENTTQRNVKWYVQNEGFGEFTEVLNENNLNLDWPKFDQNDNVICSISVNDGFDNSNYFNSSAITHTENSVPNLYEIRTSSNFTNPVQVGEDVTLTAKVYDNDLTFGEMLNVTFCKNEINTIETKGGSDLVDIGLYNQTSNEGTAYPVLWIFSELKETPIEIIRLEANKVFSNNISSPFSEPIYDLYAYEVDNFGVIPSNHLDFVTSDYDNIIIANESTRMNLEYNTIISQDKFLAIKLCIDSDDDGNCDLTNGNGDYFTVNGNKSLNDTSGENKSYFGYAEMESQEQTMFHSDDISFTHGLSRAGGADCGNNLMCTTASDPANEGPIFNLSCKYNIKSMDFSNQTFSAFASDKFFLGSEYYYDPDSKTSRTLTTQFYINHPPIASNVELELSNTSVIETYTTDNQSLYCDYSISDTDTGTFTGTDYDTTSYSIEWYYKQSGDSDFEKLIAPPETDVIAHGNTNAGDQWYCNVTPRDGFTSGITKQSQIITIIGNDEEAYFTRPVLNQVKDGSNGENTGVYLGNNLSVNVQWNSIESPEYTIYTCSGNYTEVNFIGTGCTGNQFDSTVINGDELPGNGAKNHTISFLINNMAMGGPHYYTVFVCDNNFTCSTAKPNATGDFYVRETTQQFEIKIKDPQNLTISSPITVTGVLSETSNNTVVDAWTYIAGEPYPFKVANTTTFSEINNKIATGTTELASTANTTLVYISNIFDADTDFNGTNKFIGFEHNRSSFVYYEYDYVGANINYLILNLTEPLEQSVSAGEDVKTYVYKNHTGRFDIQLNLWSNEWNSLEFYSRDGGYLEYDRNIFYDPVGPTISVESSGINQSIIQNNGNITIEILDTFDLDLSTISVEVTSIRNNQQFTLQKNGDWEIIEVPNVRDYLVKKYTLLSADGQNTTLVLEIAEDAPDENYTVFIEAIDTPGNYANHTAEFEYNKKPVNITNPYLIDEVTGNESLRSNKLFIHWNTTDEPILENFTVELIEKTNTNETTIFTNYTTNKNMTFTYDNLSTSACYYAKIGANSRFGISSEPVNTNCAYYSESDNLILEVNSNNKNSEVIYFNTTIIFEIETYNAAEIAYRVEKISNNEIVEQVTGITTQSEIADKYQATFDKDGNWDVPLYTLFVNATGFEGQFEEVEYLMIMDTLKPEILPLMSYDNFNNTDNITLSVLGRDDGDIREVILESNYSGEKKNYSVVNNEMVQIGGITYYNYTIKLDNDLIESDIDFDIKFKINDFADNSNISETKTITINNRAPYNVTKLPKIYWNKTMIYTEYNLSPYFNETDGDVLNYSLNNYGFHDIDIKQFAGTLFGSFKNFVGNTTNLTITVDDGKGLSDTENITVILLTESCVPYIGNNSVFVGFSAVCGNNEDTGNNNPGDEKNEDEPTTGGGGSSGRSSSSRTGFAPVIVNSGEIVKKLYNIESDGRTVADFANSVVTEIQFRYSEDVAFVELKINESDSAPPGVTIPKETVWKYFVLDHTNIQNSKLDEVIIRIRVAKNNTIGLNSNNVLLARWSGRNWNTYEAVNYGSDSEYYYYAGRVPGMSKFAIVKEKKVEVETDMPTQVTTPTKPDSGKSTRPTQVVVPTEDETNVWPIIIFSIGIIIIIVGIGGFYLIHQKPQQKQINPVKIEPEVVVDPLEEYIKKHLQKGIPFAEINAALLKAGWNVKEIDYAFNKIENSKKEVNLALVDEQLVKQIKGMQDKKYTKKEIKEELESRFIQEEIITANIYYVEVLGRLEKEVRTWIEKGYTKKQIRDHLLDLKWPAMTVYDILKKYK